MRTSRPSSHLTNHLTSRLARLWFGGLLTILFTTVPSLPSWADGVDHSPWNHLLQAHVVSDNGGQSTRVNYQGMADQHLVLDRYLMTLAHVQPNDFDQWSANEQLAFLINAYNAWTVALILTEWPELTSIKDLGSWFRSPWRKAFIPLFGKTVTLDHIEHELIRGSGRYNNPLIHVAVNCASIGCPPLRAEAYTGDQLDTQLQEQTRRFLSNTRQNHLTGDTLAVSSIFKWYRDDFEQGWLGFHRLEDFFLTYATALSLPEDVVKRLQAGTQDIEFQDYDWRLNQTH